MNKVSLLISVLFFILLSRNAEAQPKTGADYFTGKWNVLVKGTPNGDAKMFFVLEKKDSTLTGSVQDSTGTEIAKIDRAELIGDTATVYFNTQGFDVNLEMKKKDEDHIIGSMMSMFDAEGARIKDAKKE
jgi:hypothetical protein